MIHGAFATRTNPYRHVVSICCLVALLLAAGSCDRLERALGEHGDDAEQPTSQPEKVVEVEGNQEPGAKPITGEVVVAQSFTGKWRTAWGPVELVQDGAKLSGSYSGKFRGTLTGKVTGPDADVVWKQTNGERGKAHFTLSDDGNSFTGTWGSGSSHTNGGAWNGKRID